MGRATRRWTRARGQLAVPRQTWRQTSTRRTRVEHVICLISCVYGGKGAGKEQREQSSLRSASVPRTPSVRRTGTPECGGEPHLPDLIGVEATTQPPAAARGQAPSAHRAANCPRSRQASPTSSPWPSAATRRATNIPSTGIANSTADSATAACQRALAVCPARAGCNEHRVAA